MNKLILIILIVLLIFFLYYNIKNYDKFEIINNYDIYVISLKNNERLNNIKIQENAHSLKINIFEAVDGNYLNQDELIKSGLLSNNFSYDSIKRSKEIACYQSHLNLLKYIKNTSINKYSIIFEDDFQIKKNNFKNTIEKIKNYNFSFDIIFLGNPNNNHKNNIIDNLYDFDIDGNLWGAYAYLINNENIDKIFMKQWDGNRY